MTPKFPTDSYYGSRGSLYRPDSVAEERGNGGMSRPGSYYDNLNGPSNGPSNGYYPTRARYPRTATEPVYNNGTGVYPTHGHQQSYETVTTASGSGSSGEALGYSTDPSSENSSIDRIQPAEMNRYNGAPKPPMHNLNFHGYGPNTGEAPMMSGGYPGQNGGPPPPPQKDAMSAPRVPIKLGSSGADSGPTTYEPPRPGGGEKRKSWFGKRFGKS